mmetsp:Transcript_11953/g.24721  ORF Transcript_11953/g.24721 Transcript_11953/m.24721 type:complete len:449 (+) Transcript_11953:1948-3294(+)
MAPNNLSRDDLVTLLDEHSRREDSPGSNSYDRKQVEKLLLQHSGRESIHNVAQGQEMCYSDRAKPNSSSNENNNNRSKDKMTAAAAVGQLRKRSGSSSDGSTCSASDMKTLGGKRTLGRSDSLALAKFPLFKVTVPLFLLLAVGTKFLAKNFPYVLAPWAATHTYKPAHWQYDEDDTHFDNSAWTWGTDYWLTAAMLFLAGRCLTATPTGRINDPSAANSYQLRIRSATMLVLYAISTLAGGYAHHNYHGIDDLNTTSFRVLWSICVGTVTSAGAAMLWIGSELCRQYHANVCSTEIMFRIPTIPRWFCAAWGIYITGLCVLGEMSYKRPACDIFVAGTTQTVPTAYVVALLAAHRWTSGRKTDDHPVHACDRVQMKYRIMYYAGFLFNVPLLPMYPLLVQYTDWSLGAVNTLLHAWLTVSWGMQGFSLRHFCMALSADKKESLHVTA